MRVLKNMTSGAGTIGELFQFLWAKRLWWLLPFVGTLLLLAILLLIGQASGIAPFIYTIF
jgi:hypothetical protein